MQSDPSDGPGRREGSAAAPLIRVDGLTVRRGRRTVLAGVTFELGAGLVAVVGRNGCGKSSLVRILATLDEPTAGEVAVAGHDLGERRSRRAARQELGYLAPEWTFPGGASVLDALRHAAWLQRVTDPDEAVAVALAAADLGAVAHERLSTLATGTRRRVGFAQASIHQPAVLLLEEPTAGLDVAQRERLWRLLGGRRATGTTVIVTQDLLEVRDHADQVLVLADGAIAHLGRPRDLVLDGGTVEGERRRLAGEGVPS